MRRVPVLSPKECIATFLCVLALHMLLANTGIAQAEQPADRIDADRYPNMHRFFSSIDLRAFKGGPVADVDRWWCPAEEYIAPPQ